MEESRFIRSEMVFGTDGMEKIKKSRVAVFGLGGVGGACAEALARGGVGAFFLVDHDTISLSNCNRQIIALTETIGRYKADVMKERILSINPEAQIEICKDFFLPEKDAILKGAFSYLVDAIDTVTAKIALAEIAKARQIPIIASMGTGNKLNPQMLLVADLYQTSVCPLAKVMRRELKKRGVTSLKVVYSKEEPCPNRLDEGDAAEGAPVRKRTPGSVSFVPPVAGMLMAAEVLKDIAEV